LKHPATIGMSKKRHVAPRRGAWIETTALADVDEVGRKSHPAGVRGLKRRTASDLRIIMGVAPRRGAWIETFAGPASRLSKRSHPAGVRGLKRGIKIARMITMPVAPRRGAWIETAS